MLLHRTYSTNHIFSIAHLGLQQRNHEMSALLPAPFALCWDSVVAGGFPAQRINEAGRICAMTSCLSWFIFFIIPEKTDIIGERSLDDLVKLYIYKTLSSPSIYPLTTKCLWITWPGSFELIETYSVPSHYLNQYWIIVISTLRNIVKLKWK